MTSWIGQHRWAALLAVGSVVAIVGSGASLQPTASLASQTVVVDIGGSCGTFCFSPPTLNVNLNDSVQWTNMAAPTHTATRCTAGACGSDLGSGPQTFDSGPLSTGASSSPFEFTTPGTYTYYCSIHGYATMHAYIVVNPPAGSVHFLVNPIRLLDTRPGFTAATNPGAPLPANVAFTLQVTGQSVGGGVQVPAGAVGVIGNLTITGPTSYGDMVAFPANASAPNASNINWVAGQTIANSLTIGLSSDGKIKLLPQMQQNSFTTDAIFDATGYVM
jgi:plastocyanin